MQDYDEEEDYEEFKERDEETRINTLRNRGRPRMYILHELRRKPFNRVCEVGTGSKDPPIQLCKTPKEKSRSQSGKEGGTL